MKKLLIALMMMLLVVGTSAEESRDSVFRLQYRDSITAADSATIRTNTTFSNWHKIGNGNVFQYGLDALSGTNDTNWANDTLLFALQLSFDGSTERITKTILLDTLLDAGSAMGVQIYNTDTIVWPTWGRLRLIHRDSIAVGEADSALVAGDAVYVKNVNLWYIWR